MTEAERDQYDKGREAMDALLEAIEGEVVQTVRIEKGGVQYHDVKVLLSEYPVQWIEVNCQYVKVDGDMVGMTDLDEGDEIFISKARVEWVDKMEDRRGHRLQLDFKVTDEGEVQY